MFYSGIKTLLAASLVASCGQSSQSTVSEGTSAVASDSRKQIQMSLVQKPQAENVVWSAASLDGLLALVGLGYDDERQTLLETFFGKSVKAAAAGQQALNLSADGIKVSSANNLWTRHDFKLLPGYLRSLASNYDGLVPSPMDVAQPQATANEINAWAAKQTNNLINHIVDPQMITPDLASLLANALYFKGEWKVQFKKEQTGLERFQVVAFDGQGIDVQEVKTMKKYGSAIQVRMTRGDDRKVTVRLPYKGERHAMYISFAADTMPTTGWGPIITHVDASRDVLDLYKTEIVEGGAFDGGEFYDQEFDVFMLPKFEIETKLEGIHADMIENGYADLFSQGALSRMSSDPRAQLSFILQKAKIIVDEEGSEAAAVTIGGVTTTSIRQSTELRIDGPFAFAIRDEVAKTTLFEGVVRNPGK